MGGCLKIQISSSLGKTEILKIPCQDIIYLQLGRLPFSINKPDLAEGFQIQSE